DYLVVPENRRVILSDNRPVGNGRLSSFITVRRRIFRPWANTAISMPSAAKTNEQPELMRSVRSGIWRFRCLLAVYSKAKLLRDSGKKGCMRLLLTAAILGVGLST